MYIYYMKLHGSHETPKKKCIQPYNHTTQVRLIYKYRTATFLQLCACSVCVCVSQSALNVYRRYLNNTNV